MSIARTFHSSAAMREILHLLIWCVMLAGGLSSQTDQSQPSKATSTIDKDKIADALSKASEDSPESIYFVEQLARVKAVQAVPMLEAKFVRTKDALDKAHVASALVRLGNKDDLYWDFLVDRVTPALDSDAPDFMNFDPQAKTAAGPSPEFVAWANAHGQDPQSAGRDAMYLLPGRLVLLASTGDQRAIPLLRRGLSSPNHMIEIAAADGLVELQDKESIPLIIEACKRAPIDAAAVIAQPLVYFDDAEAQIAVDTYVPKGTAKGLREGKAQGKKTPLN